MAAGSGSRFGEKKQFKLLKGKALYFYSLKKLHCNKIMHNLEHQVVFLVIF